MRQFFNPALRLLGSYSGHRDDGISYRFRFCRDGTYFYCAEEVGQWKLAHQGIFRLAQKRLAGAKITVARFEPRQLNVAAGFGPMAILEARALPTYRIEEYKVQSYKKTHAHNPSLEVEHIAFAVADRDGNSSSDEWEIQKVI